jgi:hypothetical protein
MPIGNPVTLTSNVASKVISVTATASGQTVFTVQGGYRINQISVFRNGVRLTESDYTARDGASVTLLSPATLADVLEFQVFDDFRVADAIVSAASNQTIFGNLTVTGTLTGATIGIQSGGTVVGTAKTLNFVGTGNTFAVNGDTIDVSIAGGGGGGGGIGTVINYADSTPSPFSFIDAEVTVTQNLNLDATNAGATTSYVVSVIPNVIIGAGIGVTVGVGKTMVIDVLQIGDL